MEHRVVTLPFKDGNNLVLNRYRADTDLPRPESFLEDTKLAADASLGPKESSQLYREICSAAESGLDFTGRWFRDGKGNLTDMHTTDLIPADLNAILQHNERTLAELFQVVGDGKKADLYKAAAVKRVEAMEKILWNADTQCWLDYNLPMKKQVTITFYLSNLAPVWHEAHQMSAAEIEKILTTHWQLLTNYSGGIPFDETVTGQQWDFPNIWAPFQQYFVVVFERLAKQVRERNSGSKEHWKLLNALSIQPIVDSKTLVTLFIRIRPS